LTMGKTLCILLLSSQPHIESTDQEEYMTDSWSRESELVETDPMQS
jgi:hypothetical protein